MADIDLMIRISEKEYNIIKKSNGPMSWAEHLIKNGTPLPKGHGRLIDADAFIATMEDASKRQKYKKLLINDCLTVDDVFKAVIESIQNEGLAEGDAPTLIEADNEDKEVTNEQTKSEEEIRDALFRSWLEAAKALRKWAEMLKELETLKVAEPKEEEK